MYWYNQDIEWLEKKEVAVTSNKKVVFYGSSTFTLWENLEQEFSNFQAVNLGFGGSTLAACAWFFNRVVPRQNPDIIVIYAGDNDLGDGRTPEEVVLFYFQLVSSIQKFNIDIPIYFISIKLSPSRKHLKGSIEYTNHTIKNYINESSLPLHFIDIYDKMLNPKGEIIQEFYKPDGLHLSDEGYALWKEEIYRELEKCLVC